MIKKPSAANEDGDGFYDSVPSSPKEHDDNRDNSGTDDEFFDAHDGQGKTPRRRSSNDSDRPYSPNSDEEKGKGITHLKNLAGLNSPTAPINAERGSVSSLSTLSQDKDDQGFREKRNSSNDSELSNINFASDAAKSSGYNRSSVSSSSGGVDESDAFFSLFEASSALTLGPIVRTTSANPSTSRKGLIKDKLKWVQTLDMMHDGAIWTMKFSPNGSYLATGGQDGKVILWCVAEIVHLKSTSGNKVNDETEDESERMLRGKKAEEHRKSSFANVNQEVEGASNHAGPFIINEPYRILEGHSSDVIDLSWSRSMFVLSASTDKTVRLWHVSRKECLQYFRHPDIVTSVEFHPLHDRYFISGCFDRKLRVWDIIPDGNVKEWAIAPDTITSVCFSPDGSTVAGGLIQGQIYFYEYEGMKYKTQMDCRNRNGKYKKGTKVTGMCYVKRKDAADMTEQDRRKSTTPGQLLVTTNDSRIRLCRLEDYSIMGKYKGLRNKSMQIKATISEDSRFVICGSDNGSVYIWRNVERPRQGSLFFSADIMRNGEFESFESSDPNSGCICAIFAPVDSVKRYIRAQSHLLENPNYAGTVFRHQNQKFVTPEKDRKTAEVDDLADYSSRIILTCDSDGFIKVFFRLI